MVNSQFLLWPDEITEVSTTWYIGQDISLIQFLPHSHLLGKTWEIFAITPDYTIPLIRINDWNFDWQSWYSPEYMIHLPAETIVHATCTYDNTSDNPNNPNDPPQLIFWGSSTTDEMFFVPFRYVEYQDGDEYIYLGHHLLGDVNGDELWNVLDVVMLVNCALAENCDTLDYSQNADVNGDENYNVLDVVMLVNLILDN
jgi:hypothetical protein